MKLYVELPHQGPATAYWATDNQLICFACDREFDYLDEHYPDDIPTTIDQALEAIGHDLSGLLVFDSKQEAMDYFQAEKRHNEISAIRAIRELEETP